MHLIFPFLFLLSPLTFLLVTFLLVGSFPNLSIESSFLTLFCLALSLSFIIIILLLLQDHLNLRKCPGSPCSLYSSASSFRALLRKKW
uniref:Putative polygalacturonase n=1 Tax=Rhizophora mucronata TaxID=61149 RepID=A0A2P2LUK7_RHIMU